ncbi:single-stranded DNA-binding protein [Roseburia sp. NSJ-9]|uniref:Single-stranded DNA-binding protein n=1 Tax=Roseburia lenta TaxID=2763061 RepID=A0ABR7GDT8_9FIRM|nr:single-stranded DNA-binding protein [Roseburia lenta]MBC5685584.1 single-stranded DNA-binding protein [Roseburia lenta]
MNKIIMMGRLTRDPEIRYGGVNNDKAVARYTIAVDRRFKQEGQPQADFFNVVSFGKAAEFVEKYLRKGTKIVIEGELQNNDYTNKNGEKVYSIQIVTSQIEFAESKASQNHPQEPPVGNVPDEGGFMSIPDDIEDELPFN